MTAAVSAVWGGKGREREGEGESGREREREGEEGQSHGRSYIIC